MSGRRTTHTTSWTISRLNAMRHLSPGAGTRMLFNCEEVILHPDSDWVRVKKHFRGSRAVTWCVIQKYQTTGSEFESGLSPTGRCIGRFGHRHLERTLETEYCTALRHREISLPGTCPGAIFGRLRGSRYCHMVGLNLFTRSSFPVIPFYYNYYALVL